VVVRAGAIRPGGDDRSTFAPGLSLTFVNTIMDALHIVEQQCPWCGEPIDLTIDSSVGPAEYTEDCPVCCAPLVVRVEPAETGEPALLVSVARENE
jgi:hypothetical protein